MATTAEVGLHRGGALVRGGGLLPHPAPYAAPWGSLRRTRLRVDLLAFMLFLTAPLRTLHHIDPSLPRRFCLVRPLRRCSAVALRAWVGSCWCLAVFGALLFPPVWGRGASLHWDGCARLGRVGLAFRSG